MAKKYIDADLLLKKIEHLKAVHIGHAAITKETNAVDGLNAALQIIDTLQKEQPSEDLEAEVSRYIEDNFTLTDEVLEMSEEDRLYSMDKSDMLRIARHFYILGLKNNIPVTQIILDELAKEGESVNEDLEKYASRAGFDYVDDIESKYPNHRWNDHDVEFAYRDGIIAGAEWQEKHSKDGTEEK